jgi:hypothetical protein
MDSAIADFINLTGADAATARNYLEVRKKIQTFHFSHQYSTRVYFFIFVLTLYLFLVVF